MGASKKKAKKPSQDPIQEWRDARNAMISRTLSYVRVDGVKHLSPADAAIVMAFAKLGDDLLPLLRAENLDPTLLRDTMRKLLDNPSEIDRQTSLDIGNCSLQVEELAERIAERLGGDS